MTVSHVIKDAIRNVTNYYSEGLCHSCDLELPGQIHITCIR